jgi:hypothetical protein
MRALPEGDVQVAGQLSSGLYRLFGDGARGEHVAVRGATAILELEHASIQIVRRQAEGGNDRSQRDQMLKASLNHLLLFFAGRFAIQSE